MVINHLLIGMIIQVGFNGMSPVGFEPTPLLAPEAEHFCEWMDMLKELTISQEKIWKYRIGTSIF